MSNRGSWAAPASRIGYLRSARRWWKDCGMRERRVAAGIAAVLDALCYPCVHKARCVVQATKVGIREFRENLSNYLGSKTPVAITRHGTTIGIYVPTRPKPSQADLEALRVAGEKMQELIAAAGTSEDELMEEYKRLRHQRRLHKS
jgi:antitoxin (DNA-binding transcriptional repressor) of toxin-antitoxin stability system